VTARQGRVAAGESVVLDSRDEAGHGGDTMGPGIQDDDGAETLLADGLTGVDAEGGTEAFERPLV